MDLAPDFDEFIESLIARGAELLIVGAHALAFHGAPRFTGDLDILIRPWSDRVIGPCGRHQVSFIGRETFLRNTRAAEGRKISLTSTR